MWDQEGSGLDETQTSASLVFVVANGRLRYPMDGKRNLLQKIAGAFCAAGDNARGRSGCYMYTARIPTKSAMFASTRYMHVGKPSRSSRLSRVM